MFRFLKYSIILFIHISLSGCVRDKEEVYDGADLQVGNYLPDFTVSLNNGSTISNNSLEGKVSLILFFSVTCPDCQQLLPVAEKLYQDYKENNDFTMIAISREQGKNMVAPFWENNNYTIPYSAQDTRYIYSLFAKAIVPRIYIANKQNIITSIFTDNPLPTYDDLKKAVGL